ncbi:hypothetical protein [Aureimonas pseudogalii]|uniref:Uncharacterized protein n=1 Tax=Aureimonas pseudogalii TaxID=1744844 RepID=A0A7W6H8J8_9HYPH|nr:hypothetical protein [Aureimonas pseudogalii]MBB4000563.1 hypothetical protein [Aureimonas pseudogalii]
MLEFADLTDVTKAAVDQSWTYVLEICRAKALRPEMLVPRAANAIAFFTKGLVLYANDRSVGAAAFGESSQINAAGQAASNTLARHLEVTAREALVGYAGGSAIYPQSQWPLTRWQAARAKAGSASIFLAGAATGALLKRLVELVLP